MCYNNIGLYVHNAITILGSFVSTYGRALQSLEDKEILHSEFLKYLYMST